MDVEAVVRRFRKILIKVKSFLVDLWATDIDIVVWDDENGNTHIHIY